MDNFRRFLAKALPFRGQRLKMLQQALPNLAKMSVVDIGGDASQWNGVAASVVVVNTYLPAKGVVIPNYVVADGRQLPFRDGTFDLAYSNSVIEHLGCRENQERFAAEQRRVGCAYYVQTPNFWFPIEPHFLALCIHWLPRRAQRPLVRYCTLYGIMGNRPQAELNALVDELALMGRKDVAACFPDGELRKERFAGLTKSWIAMRS